MKDTISISAIQQAITYHKQQASKLEQALAMLMNVEYVNKSPSFTVVDDTPKESTNTFKDDVIDLLSTNNKPLTGRAIFDLLKIRRTVPNYNSFSAQLSGLVKNGTIVKHIVNENPIGSRYYYCLKEWFTNGKLKEGYINVI